jgi:hypothetical protein
MTKSEEIVTFLARQPGEYCDDCISEVLKIHPRQTVNAVCRRLELEKKIQRKLDRCDTCGKTKTINTGSMGLSGIRPAPDQDIQPRSNIQKSTNISINAATLTARQFEARVQQFVTRYFNKPFSEQALDIGQGKLHKFDLVSGDKAIVIECKSYNWTEGGNYPSGKIATLKEALFYFGRVRAQKKILVMHHRTFPGKELLIDVFYRQNRNLLEDITLWDFIIADSPSQDTIRIVHNESNSHTMKTRGAA